MNFSHLLHYNINGGSQVKLIMKCVTKIAVSHIISARYTHLEVGKDNRSESLPKRIDNINPGPSDKARTLKDYLCLTGEQEKVIFF